MKRKSSKYWNERFRQLEEAQNRLAQMSFKDIESQYRAAQKELEGKINTWYKRLADNNSISMADARRLLSKNELAEFKWSLKDYIKYGKENAVNEKWVKELENASAKFHISKYQALMIDTRQSFEQFFGKQLGIVTETMGNVFENGYYRTAYELQRGVGIGFDVAKLNREEVKLVLSKPWAVDGKNFSERIWGNREKLINEAHNEITKNIITGADPQKAIDAIAKKMNTSKSNAGRLVMTEEAYFSSAAQGKSYKDLGVEKYEILATLDDVTSKLCRSLDGKVFDMKDYKPGVTAPPFHNYCRSTTVPQLDEEIWGVGERAARDKDGKTYYVPDNIKYHEWEEKFVNGGDKSGLVEVDKSENGGIIRSSGSNDNTSNEHFVEKLGKIDPNDNEAVTKEITQFIKNNENSDIEKCLVIAKDGEMYQVHGSQFTVNTDLLGDVMIGSTNIHNHVTGASSYSFSYDDLKSSAVDGSKTVLAFDEKYIYQMNNIPSDLSIEKVYNAYEQAKNSVMEDLFKDIEIISEEDEQHERIRRACETLGIEYERKKVTE